MFNNNYAPPIDINVLIFIINTLECLWLLHLRTKLPEEERNRYAFSTGILL